jgi:crotonobetainyl-CoA:carnitine CoA-transferase CaiB-like acyl-CoA transferase
MHDLMYAINMRAQAKEFIPLAQKLDLGKKFLPIYNQYPTKDGLIVITTLTEKQWVKLAEDILRKPELVKDPRFDNPIKRFNYIDLLDDIIERWTKTVTTREALKILESYRIPCGRSISMRDAVNHPNLKARGVLNQQFDFSKWNVEKASIPGPLIKYSKTKGSVESVGPEFKSDNEDIYCGLLGYTKNDLNQFKEKNVI